VNLRSQAPSREGKQSAARADVDEGQPVEPFARQRDPERFFSFRDAIIVEAMEKRPPVFTEAEADIVTLFVFR